MQGRPDRSDSGNRMSERNAEPRETDDPAAPGSASELPLLVAEDEPVARALLVAHLKKAGYAVLEAENGRRALELARAADPVLVLSDWRMPEMDGTDLCREIRQDPELCHLYFVMFTSRSDTDALVEALDAGADDYIPKPWEPREMLARVRAGLRVATLQRELAERTEEVRQINQVMTREIEVLDTMQKAMLPQSIPKNPSLEFASWYFASTTSGGGDYYDVLELDDEHQGFVIADVSGHGAPAMVAMALLRQNVHQVAPRFHQPGALLEELNRLLYDHLPTDQFATMFYAIINTKTLVCQYASAGHNPPLWFRRAAGETIRLPHCEGFPLKLVKRDVVYPSHLIQLQPGDKVVFYTDGIPECFNPMNQDYGMERFETLVHLHAATSTPMELEAAVVHDVMRFNDGQIPGDDLTLAILGVKDCARSDSGNGGPAGASALSGRRA